jgi:dethiobiotin synthetase
MGTMQRAYFITATGTDLGKTWVAAGLVRACIDRDVAARAIKPVMSGYDEANPAAGDAGVLLQKVGAGATAEAVAAIAPWRFKAALSPDRAGALEGKAIDFAALVEWCRAQVDAIDGLLLIEGIGGVMVPLDERNTVRELIAVLGIPVLLVAGSYLGALSHTLTALASLREAGIVPAAIVLNESPGSRVSLEDSAASLAPHLDAVPLLALRRDDAAGLARLADFLLAGKAGAR